MISKMDSGEYYCEARNSVGHRRCPGKRMQVGKQGILRSAGVRVGCGLVVIEAPRGWMEGLSDLKDGWKKCKMSLL